MYDKTLISVIRDANSRLIQLHSITPKGIIKGKPIDSDSYIGIEMFRELESGRGQFLGELWIPINMAPNVIDAIEKVSESIRRE